MVEGMGRAAAGKRWIRIEGNSKVAKVQRWQRANANRTYVGSGIRHEEVL